MYYRVAIRHDASPAWQWKSTTISSLNALFQFLRRFEKLPQDSLRVFSSSCIEEMEEQLARENNGSGSRSVTAAQFRQERMMGAQTASSNMYSNGTHPTGRAASQTTSRADFWNLMALAK